MKQEKPHYFFNGINGESGVYNVPPMDSQELATAIRGEAEPENLADLRFRYLQRTTKALGVKEGLDPKKLDQAGWGVIFAGDAGPEVEKTLQPLLDLRREQAGDRRYRVYNRESGYQAGRGDSKDKFLARHGAGPGPADPDRVPYYLLVVGSPEAIPYDFQHQLGIQYAVGRIHFDTLQEYANYAASVVAAEAGQVKLPCRAAFFGSTNRDDPVTEAMAAHLVEPLASAFGQRRGGEWFIDAVSRGQADKQRLTGLMGGDETPALLLTASHGMGFPVASPRHRTHQGALLCADWPGPSSWGQQPVPAGFYFSAEDLGNDASLVGLIALVLASYGAGFASSDRLAELLAGTRRVTAPAPFLAPLARRMLSHPGGGALAVIGQVGQAGFGGRGPAGVDLPPPTPLPTFGHLLATLTALTEGYLVGTAVEPLRDYYAESATIFSDALEEIKYGKSYDPGELISTWVAAREAGNYAIIGDPAVRLPVARPGESFTPRTMLEPITGEAEEDVASLDFGYYAPPSSFA